MKSLRCSYPEFIELNHEMLLAELPGTSLPFDNLLVFAGLLASIALVFSIAILLITNRKVRKTGRHAWTSRAIYALFFGSVIVLSASSFGSILQEGHMAGYPLLMHIGAAGAFVFLLLGVAVLYLPFGQLPAPKKKNAPREHRWWFARWTAWSLVAGGILTAGTMFLSMLPILDTPALLEVAQLHRYAGLFTALAAVFHLYALICTRVGLR